MDNLPQGFNPLALLERFFDEEGNMHPMYRMMLKGALANFPALMQNLPANTPGIEQAKANEDAIKQLNFANMSDEEFDRQMKTLYFFLKNQKK